MNDMKRDLIRIQELVGMAFSETESLVALTDGGQMNPNKPVSYTNLTLPTIA